LAPIESAIKLEDDILYPYRHLLVAWNKYVIVNAGPNCSNQIANVVSTFLDKDDDLLNKTVLVDGVLIPFTAAKYTYHAFITSPVRFPLNSENLLQ
jgi:hypothetical protein